MGGVASRGAEAAPGMSLLTSAQRALVVVAHPDDVEAHCGGTVLLLTDRGCAVTLAVCTSGEKGTADRSLSPARLGQLREAEQEEAARILGIQEVLFLRYPDGEVENTRELRGQLVRLIRRVRPDVAITHDPENPWPPYTAHRDHHAVGRATLDALYPDARDHLYYPEQITEERLEPHRTPQAWLIMSQVPDWVVDIGPVFERKIAARLAHASQHRDAAALEHAYRTRAAELGMDTGIALAEVLKVVRFR